MNLLTDPWIPIREHGQALTIGLEDLLCENRDWQISCPRDDFELATLQMLIGLVQTLFMPADNKELRRREAVPMNRHEYQQGIADRLDWFDLLHPSQPFMQHRGVEAKESTPIQKLFVGLPEGNNPAYFNPVGEMAQVGLNYVAIALFNQASNSPSFGGGFKGSLRGGAPITVLIKGRTLRQTIWRNVLSRQMLEAKGYSLEKDVPNWIRRVSAKDQVSPAEMGVSRGLFWQPAHIELEVVQQPGKCDLSGEMTSAYVKGFRKEKFDYQLIDVWRHPHSPREWSRKKGEQEIRYPSFTHTAPAWTELTAIIVQEEYGEQAKEGHELPLTISQYIHAFRGESLTLMIGGYRNKQALILQRRHELVSLSEGWEEQMPTIHHLLKMAKAIHDELRAKTFGYGKSLKLDKPDGLSRRASEQFYLRSESTMYGILREITSNSQEKAVIEELFGQLNRLARDIFDRLSLPYQHSPTMLEAYVGARNRLKMGLAKLRKQYITQEAEA